MYYTIIVPLTTEVSYLRSIGFRVVSSHIGYQYRYLNVSSVIPPNSALLVSLTIYPTSFYHPLHPPFPFCLLRLTPLIALLLINLLATVLLILLLLLVLLLYYHVRRLNHYPHSINFYIFATAIQSMPPPGYMQPGASKFAKPSAVKETTRLLPSKKPAEKWKGKSRASADADLEAQNCTTVTLHLDGNSVTHEIYQQQEAVQEQEQCPTQQPMRHHGVQQHGRRHSRY